MELILILNAVVILACAAETFSGFAGAMTAITLGAHFYPIERLVPVWVVLNFLMNAYIVLRHAGHADWGLLFKQVLPFMCAGLLVGLWLYPHLAGLPLKKMLGGLIVIFAGSQLVLLLRPGLNPRRPFSRATAGLWQFLAGVCQAIYATGGPFLVYSLSRQPLAKATFRATLCTVWGSLNGVLIAAFIYNGRLDLPALKFTAWLVPALPLGIMAGEWMHGRISEEQFRKAILIMLVIVGATLIF
ncbi:MAG: sulfite exporter TauE/SafE family protein [Thermodesulfobacteriota bacterium]